MNINKLIKCCEQIIMDGLPFQIKLYVLRIPTDTRDSTRLTDSEMLNGEYKPCCLLGWWNSYHPDEKLTVLSEDILGKNAEVLYTSVHRWLGVEKVKVHMLYGEPHTVRAIYGKIDVTAQDVLDKLLALRQEIEND